MAFGFLRAFTLRGRKIPGTGGIILIALAAFVIGIGAGWLTAAIPAWLKDDGSPVAVRTVVPSPSATDTLPIPTATFTPIERELDGIDILSGLTSLDIDMQGSGNFTAIPGTVEPPGSGRQRWVRIDIEDGLPLSSDAVKSYVLGILNDHRGWGANGQRTFGLTDGVADIRIVFANPATAVTLCERPHEPLASDVTEPEEAPGLPELAISPSPTPTPSPTAAATVSPTPSPTAPELEPSCAEQGVVVVDAYTWAAGLEGFGESRAPAHEYLINHFLGHLLGEEEQVCPSGGGRASVMVDHSVDISPCTANPWPYPDAEPAIEATEAP